MQDRSNHRQGLFEKTVTVIRRFWGWFRWLPSVDGVVKLSAAELSMLLEGLDWGRFWKRPGRVPQAAG